MMKEACEDRTREKYTAITRLLIEKGLTITSMESCTAGQIISLLTDTEGSSAVVKGAFVTYCNEAKVQQGVPEEVIRQYGVYSEETARAMAGACRRAYHADIGIGVTGSFGNTDPANADSVPGHVDYAIETEDGVSSWSCEIPPQPSRKDYKFFIAEKVADQILAWLL